MRIYEYIRQRVYTLIGGAYLVFKPYSGRKSIFILDFGFSMELFCQPVASGLRGQIALELLQFFGFISKTTTARFRINWYSSLVCYNLIFFSYFSQFVGVRLSYESMPDAPSFHDHALSTFLFLFLTIYCRTRLFCFAFLSSFPSSFCIHPYNDIQYRRSHHTSHPGFGDL